MATTFVLTRPDVFVSGVVAAYVKPALGVPASGAPSGSAVSSPSVVGNSVTFTGLADNTQYIAYQGSPDRYVSFRTTPASSVVAETDPVAEADLATHAALTTTAHGGLIPSGLVDAKGDLLGATADNTPARLPVGSNGFVLKAASGQATGLQWAAETTAPAFGTTLPTAVDGLEYYWEVDATNGVVWHMRYDGTLSKWLCLGGPPLMNIIGPDATAGEGTASTTYIALTTAGPAIALPGVGGGLYIVRYGCVAQCSVASMSALMSFDRGGTAAVDADWCRLASSSSGTNPVSSIMREQRIAFATQLTLTAKYRTTAGTSTFYARWMSLLPVQVNPS